MCKNQLENFSLTFYYRLIFSGFDEKVTSLTRKVEAITGVYDDLHEKMHEMDKTKRNNLLFYGIKPDFLPGIDANSFHLYFNLVIDLTWCPTEIQHQLDQKIHEIIRHRLCFSRDVPTTKITRMLTGKDYYLATFFIFLVTQNNCLWIILLGRTGGSWL